MAIVAIGGCGGGKSGGAKKSNASTANADEERRKFRTGAVTLHQFDEARKPQWSVSAKDAALVLEDGKARGELMQLTGTVYRDGELTGEVAADRGLANQNEKTLRLNGDVEIKAADGRTLTSGVAEYLPGYELLHAGDTVGVVTPKYKLMNIPAVVATADLREIGTPDMFRDKIQALMRKLKVEPKPNKLKLAMLAGILAQTGVAGAQSTFQTETITIRGWRSIKTSELADGRVKFLLSGGRITGESKNKGLVAVGNRIEGTLKEVNGKRVIETASFSGDVQVTLDNGGGRSVLTTASANLINGETPVLSAPGAVTLMRHDSGGQETTVRGASAVARLAPLDSGAKQPVRRIELSGGVTMTVTGGANGTLRATTGSVTMVPGDGTDDFDFNGSTKLTQETDLRSVELTGSGGTATIGRGAYPLQTARLTGPVRAKMTRSNKGFAEQYLATGGGLTYNDSARNVKLTGNVVLNAKARLFEGENRGTQLILSLNDKREVAEIEMNGEPGSTDYTPKKEPNR